MHVRKTRSPSAAVVVAAGAFVLAGCSAGPGSAGPGAESPRPAATSGSVAPPLTAAQLKALAFRDGEVPQARPGAVDVVEAAPGGGKRSLLPTADPACLAVVDVADGEHASAVVRQTFNWKETLWAGGSTLAAYGDGTARKHFARLKEALGSCTHYEGTGHVGTYRVRVKVEPSPQAGDEAVSFRQIVPGESGSIGDRDEQFVVVRAGDTIATFTMLDVGGSSNFPPDLIERQVQRLQDAQRR